MRFSFALLLVSLAATGKADPDFFLLQAPCNDSENAADAARAAGATVVWNHCATGLAYVSSDDPNFLDNAPGIQADKDMMIEWQAPFTTETDGNGTGDFIEPVDASTVLPPDDEYFPFQWNMEAMEASEAWAEGCTGAGVRMAILDGGIDPMHPDLAPNMDTTCSASFVPGQSYDTDLGNFWHGMHVAGIAAAAANTGGVIGVAPDATIMSIKVLHGGSGSFGWLIEGILYSSDPGAFGHTNCDKADIINMSLGAVFNKRLRGAGPLISGLNKAVNYAASQGVLVVSAAGNASLDLGQSKDITSVPAESGSGVAITATGPEDVEGLFTGTPGNPRRIASYTNYGEGTTFVSAPGGDLGIQGVVTVSSPASIAGNKRAGTATFSPRAAGQDGYVFLFTKDSDTTGDPHDACEGGIDPNVLGKIALIHRGSCSFVAKVELAQQSGAIGVIISNNGEGPPPSMGGTPSGTITIPTMSISQSDGADIEVELEQDEVFAAFISNPYAILDRVLSACKGTSSAPAWCFAFGTSMASPAVAGVAALIKGANPSITLGDLKNKLKDTADDEGKNGNDEFYGHGFVNARRACTD